jgi:hypothetical protein
VIVGTVVGTLAIVAATIVIGLLVDRKTKLLPRPKQLGIAPSPTPRRAAAGETPATAIRAGDAQLQRLRSGQRCATCRMELVAEPDDNARFEGGVLVLLRLRCPRCATRRTIYVHAM